MHFITVYVNDRKNITDKMLSMESLKYKIFVFETKLCKQVYSLVSVAGRLRVPGGALYREWFPRAALAIGWVFNVFALYREWFPRLRWLQAGCSRSSHWIGSGFLGCAGYNSALKVF